MYNTEQCVLYKGKWARLFGCDKSETFMCGSLSFSSALTWLFSQQMVLFGRLILYEAYFAQRKVNWTQDVLLDSHRTCRLKHCISTPVHLEGVISNCHSSKSTKKKMHIQHTLSCFGAREAIRIHFLPVACVTVLYRCSIWPTVWSLTFISKQNISSGKLCIFSD